MVNTSLGRFAGLALHPRVARSVSVDKNAGEGRGGPARVATDPDWTDTGGYFGTVSSFRAGEVVRLEPSATSRDVATGAALWALEESQHGVVAS